MRFAKDWAVVGVSALLTALTAGPFVVPQAASAGPEKALLKAFLEPQPFDAGGVGLTMDIDAETCRPGEKLGATLKATNRSDAAAERKLKIVMHVTPRSSPMARMIPMPKAVWTTELTLKLDGGGTQSVALRPEVVVQPGETVTFSVEGDGKGGLLARHVAAVPEEDATRIVLPLPRKAP